MRLLTQNSKLKKTSELTGRKTLDFALMGGKTCPTAKDCLKFCYDIKFQKLYPTVTPKREKNYNATLEDDFCLNMLIEIIESEAQVIRIHSGGDFYNREYLHKWFKIIESLPHVTFYAYTKEVSLLKAEKLPTNFTVIFSFGGKEDHLIDIEKDRHSKVFNKGELPIDYAYANDNDHIALAQNHKIGLIKH